MASWENSPKKEGAYPKREIHTDRLQKWTQVAYNRLQQSDIDCKVYELAYKRLEKSDILQKFTDTLIEQSCSVRFLRLQKFVVFTFWDYKSSSVRFLRLQK